MSKNAHTDAPVTDAKTGILYSMVMRQVPYAEIKDFLTGIYNLAARLENCPGYVQPNGFITFKLGGIDGDNLLRLHLWPENLPELAETAGVHDHVFDFTSLLLGGTAPMINRIYEPRPDPASDQALYRVDYINPSNVRVVKLGDHFKAVETKVETIQPGSYYNLEAGLFHTSEIEGHCEALTLIATKINPSVSSPRFLSARNADIDYVRPALTPNHRQQAISCLQKFL